MTYIYIYTLIYAFVKTPALTHCALTTCMTEAGRLPTDNFVIVGLVFSLWYLAMTPVSFFLQRRIGAVMALSRRAEDGLKMSNYMAGASCAYMANPYHPQTNPEVRPLYRTINATAFIFAHV